MQDDIQKRKIIKNLHQGIKKYHFIFVSIPKQKLSFVNKLTELFLLFYTCQMFQYVFIRQCFTTFEICTSNLCVTLLNFDQFTDFNNFFIILYSPTNHCAVNVSTKLDEFIKERERYAVIGDDLDMAFVGQKLNCTFECSIDNKSMAIRQFIFILR